MLSIYCKRYGAGFQPSNPIEPLFLGLRPRLA